MVPAGFFATAALQRPAWTNRASLIATARYLVQCKQAHYRFTVKDNQPTIKA